MWESHAGIQPKKSIKVNYMGVLSIIVPNEYGSQQNGNLTVDVQDSNVENEVKAEDWEIEEMDCATFTHDENLTF